MAVSSPQISKDNTCHVYLLAESFCIVFQKCVLRQCFRLSLVLNLSLIFHQRSGRTSSKMPLRMVRKAWREASNNPQVTIKALQSSLSESGTTLSKQTLQRTLHKGGFHGCRSRKTPLLKRRNAQSGLAFAKSPLGKNVSFWLTVLWSDETKVELFGHSDLAFA